MLLQWQSSSVRSCTRSRTRRIIHVRIFYVFNSIPIGPQLTNVTQMQRPISTSGQSKTQPDVQPIYQSNHPSSVESNVVIIASSIPTLQPVLDLLLGRRTASSYGNSRNRYKDSSGRAYDSTTFNKSKQSKSTRKPGIIITDIESQESILRDHGDLRSDNDLLGGIRRTDNVTVQYELRSTNETRHETPRERTSW